MLLSCFITFCVIFNVTNNNILFRLCSIPTLNSIYTFGMNSNNSRIIYLLYGLNFFWWFSIHYVVSPTLKCLDCRFIYENTSRRREMYIQSPFCNNTLLSLTWPIAALRPTAPSINQSNHDVKLYSLFIFLCFKLN